MAVYYVGISDMKMSTNSRDVIITQALGSCVGVAAYDPLAKVGGMAHCLMPRPRHGDSGYEENPYRFVSTGVPSLVRSLITAGADRSRMLFYGAGGCQMLGETSFNVGQSNVETLLALFEANKLDFAASDFGGEKMPRTMFLHLTTGRVAVRGKGVITILCPYRVCTEEMLEE